MDFNTLPTPTDDVIDSREVIEAIEFLESDLEDDYQAYLDEFQIDPDETGLEDDPLPILEWAEQNYAYMSELNELKELADEGEGFPDWKYGMTLIHDSYFKTYAQEFAEEIGAVDREWGWPACHIDWEAAAESLQMDYSAITFGHNTYWGR